tara:strand:+ start:3331 stop:3528 length:198 start_codon:yes stop_codon:yes gene_type:complete
MTREFKVKKRTIVELLEDIEAFTNKMDAIMLKKPELEYKYIIGIDPVKDDKAHKWEVHLKLESNE